MLSKQCEEAKWTIYEDGTIISNKTKKARKVFPNKNGYLMITYTSPKGTKNYYIHRLVAKYFIGDIPEGMEVNHEDGNKKNNHYTNLKIVTPSENIRHMDKMKLRTCARFEKNGSGKLNREQAFSLILDIKKGMTNNELGRKYGLHSRYVSLIRHKRRHKQTWEEVESATTIETTSTSFDGRE